MKGHVALAHPEPNSFNGHLFGISQNVLGFPGWQHMVSALYAMDFDPREGTHHQKSRKDAKAFRPQTEQRFNAENQATRPDVDAETRCLLACDLLVVHFPSGGLDLPLS
jgi:NAD(P)H dehydrogenase (quinone)